VREVREEQEEKAKNNRAISEKVAVERTTKMAKKVTIEDLVENNKANFGDD
jgi:hypothetical protein